jgi:hypothetical protein
MARLKSIIFAAICVTASMSMVQGQTARPFPAQPNAPQQASRVITPNGQQQTPNPAGNPAQPPTAPLKPSNAGAETPQPANPPSPPTVTYRDGLLTVQALNSTLGSVLTAIRNKTGIDFEGGENNSDRVAITLGPAPAGDVLSAIFAGSRYDFVALGRPDDPSIVQRVILTPKGQPGAATAANQPQPPQPQNNGEGGDEETPDETVNAEPQDTPAQAPAMQAQPQEQPQNQQPKTQEQLLQELQQMKQQQMQQEGAPPPNPASVPRKPPL